MVAIGGQIHPAEVARALFWVLGEQPTAESVCGLHPDTNQFSQMVQVTVPAHLRQLMAMGPAAEGALLVSGHLCTVLPFTQTRQHGRHAAPSDTQAAALLAEAFQGHPGYARRTTIFARSPDWSRFMTMGPTGCVRYL